jgi:hypothetical protein
MWNSISEYLPNVSLSLVVSNLYLSYYIARYHREHFIHNHLDSLLTSATYLRQYYRRIRPIPKPKIEVIKVHLLTNSKPTELMVFNPSQEKDNSKPGDRYHICYHYQGRPYRIVLTADQFHLLEQIPDESKHPKQDLEEVNFSNTEESESLALMEQYAGPVGDFYSYLDSDLENNSHLGRYLLTEDCQNYLLNTESQVRVENLLGDEYVFTA